VHFSVIRSSLWNCRGEVVDKVGGGVKCITNSCRFPSLSNEVLLPNMVCSRFSFRENTREHAAPFQIMYQSSNPSKM